MFCLFVIFCFWLWIFRIIVDLRFLYYIFIKRCVDENACLVFLGPLMSMNRIIYLFLVMLKQKIFLLAHASSTFEDSRKVCGIDYVNVCGYMSSGYDTSNMFLAWIIPIILCLIHSIMMLLAKHNQSESHHTIMFLDNVTIRVARPKL